MRNQLLLAGLTAAALLPVQAFAQETCQQRAADRVAGTAVGAVAGALLGSAIAGRGHHTEGAVIGGVAGGVIGNQATKGPQDCAHAYGWYDDDGRWHSTDVDRSVAAGYYDRDGAWVDGPPPGYQYAQYQGRRDDDRDRYRRGAPRDWAGYPDFREREQRIASLILSGVANDRIDPDAARDLMQRLGDIRIREARAYRANGPDLPYDARERIDARLRQLDHDVDQARRGD